jgi:hypothetical protein
MKRNMVLALDTLHLLALALWLGGQATLLLAVTPALRNAGVQQALPALLNAQGTLLTVGGLVAVGVQFVLRRRYAQDRMRYVADGVRQLLTFGAFFLAQIGQYVLLPPMRSPLTESAFAAQLRNVALLQAVQIVLLAIVVGITVWMPYGTVRKLESPQATLPSETKAGGRSKRD